MLMNGNRRAQAILQPAFIQINGFHIQNFTGIKSCVINLSWINSAVYNLALSCFPTGICADSLFGSILIFNMNFSDAGQSVTIVFKMLTQAKPAFVPPITQKHFYFVFTLLQIKCKSLILNPGIIVAVSRKQALISLFFPVQIQFVKTKTNGIHSGMFHRLVHCNGFLYRNLKFFICLWCNPVSFPDSAFSGFKPCSLAFCHISIVCPDLYFPEISGLRLCLHRKNISGAYNFSRLSTVIDHFLKSFIQSHLYLRFCLMFSGSFFCHIRNTWSFQIITHWVYQVIYLQMCNLHLVSSFLFICTLLKSLIFCTLQIIRRANAHIRPENTAEIKLIRISHSCSHIFNINIR